MKMVAASKMRSDLRRLQSGGSFGQDMASNWFTMDTYAKNYLPEYDDQAKTLLVPLTSDRGLCGGVNSTIVREIKSICANNRNRFTIVTVGEKGTAALTRPFPDLLYRAITEVYTPISYTTASAIAHQVEQV